MNAAKATLPSLNIEFYGWDMKGDYNAVLKWFKGIQLPPSMSNSSGTDLKKKSITKRNPEELRKKG